MDVRNWTVIMQEVYKESFPNAHEESDTSSVKLS